MKKLFIAMVGIVFLSGSVLAQTAGRLQMLGTFGNWTAYSAQEKSGKLCYMASVPQKSEGNYKRRGDIVLIVAHRPADKTFDVVSLTAGYTYKKESAASVKIDNNADVSLFTHEDTAWANNAKTDTALVKQFKAGTKAVFKGKSSLGTATTDTFSLTGFSKAYGAMSKACGR